MKLYANKKSFSQFGESITPIFIEREGATEEEMKTAFYRKHRFNNTSMEVVEWKKDIEYLEEEIVDHCYDNSKEARIEAWH